MEYVDHIANRVTCATLVGGLWGCLSAMHKGHILSRSAGLTAFSCAMTATACFSCERIADYALNTFVVERYNNNNNNNNNNNTASETKTDIMSSSLKQTIMTHAIGGCLGGGLTGALYIRKPLRGVVFVTPLMMLVGYVEYKIKYLGRNESIDV
jgi:hypothetical protein